MNDERKHNLLELSKRVKILRRQNNLTQMQCLIDTGINFGRIEQANRDITFLTICKICNYFKIEIHEFFRFYNQVKIPDLKQTSILLVYLLYFVIKI